MSASTYWTPTRSASPGMQVAVGQVARAHGIRGEVIVVVRTDEPGLRFAPGGTLAADPPERGPLTVRASRWHSGRLIVAFEGITDRTEAEGLRGILLLLDSAQIPSPADPDEFYDHELIGLGVVTAAGAPVGVVADVLHHGQDLLVVRPEGLVATGRPGAPALPGKAGGPGAANRSDELLVPFVGAIVTDVDLAGGRLVIDPPPGLLNPEDAIEA
jgi:16S rRNA processing protein RimM